MCIIIYKDADVNPPDDTTLKNCLTTHTDGFGAMWRVGDKVAITKGLYKFAAVKKIIDAIPKETEAAFHFRMATHGGVKIGNCHPFPLSSRVDALESPYGVFDSGLVHNGVISGYGYSKQSLHSDTMNFIKAIERKTKRRYTYERLKPHMDSAGGKFVVFVPGWTYFFGDFVEDNKLRFSNSTYKTAPHIPPTRDHVWGFKQDYYHIPVVKEVMKKDVRFVGHFKGFAEYKYHGAFGTLYTYRGSYIFAEYGWSAREMELVKEDIDFAILEGEHEGGVLNRKITEVSPP